VILS